MRAPSGRTYQVIGPRATRPDGRKPFIPDYTDNKTPRPNRYSTLGFVERAARVSDAGHPWRAIDISGVELRREIASLMILNLARCQRH